MSCLAGNDADVYDPLMYFEPYARRPGQHKQSLYFLQSLQRQTDKMPSPAHPRAAFSAESGRVRDCVAAITKYDDRGLDVNDRGRLNLTIIESIVSENYCFELVVFIRCDDT